MTKNVSIPDIYSAHDSAGIVSYGAYIPSNRISVSEIARVWRKDAARIEQQLGVLQKAVAAGDENAATIAITAAQYAINAFGIDRGKIGAVYLGSESHPYAVKPTASIVADALHVGNNYTAADLQFACKAGTAGLIAAYGVVKAGIAEYGLAIGADTAQACPGDMLEYTAGSGGAAVILGAKQEEIIARIIATISYTSDTPDFWRRAQYSFPAHAGKFTQDPGYMHHIKCAVEKLLNVTGLKIADVDHVVFHQPNQKLPRLIARRLGVSDAALTHGLLVERIGNTYAGAVLLGLCSVLDHAQPGELILLCSYGSGAGSDAILLQVTEQIRAGCSVPTIAQMLEHVKHIDYAQYAIYRNLLKGEHE